MSWKIRAEKSLKPDIKYFTVNAKKKKYKVPAKNKKEAIKMVSEIYKENIKDLN